MTKNDLQQLQKELKIEYGIEITEDSLAETIDYFTKFLVDLILAKIDGV